MFPDPLPVLVRLSLLPILGFLGFLGFFGFFPEVSHAAYPPITYRYQHHLFTIDPDRYPEWRGEREEWTYQGREIHPLPEWRVDGDAVPSLPPDVQRSTEVDWNRGAIRSTLEQLITWKFDRPAGRVTIGRSHSGAVIFDGIGLTGRAVDTDAAVSATMHALRNGIFDVVLAVRETQPEIAVTDPELRSLGIQEVVTIGESNFAGSPVNRRYNIGVGLSKFNGHVIPQNSVFSFLAILGPVDGSTGYRRELVIKGDRTEPDYGGGLCQVSTTAYRGLWEYGFPIEERKNHSYAVNYYAPQGSDATVYTGSPDVKVQNDGPSALLIQTHQENNQAYFIYYGTRDKRKTDVWGPVVLGTRAAPPDRTLFTTDLPPGERRKVGDRHPGMTVMWYRSLAPESGSGKTEKILSIYEARPLFYEVGVEALPTESIEGELPAPVIDISE